MRLCVKPYRKGADDAGFGLLRCGGYLAGEGGGVARPYARAGFVIDYHSRVVVQIRRYGRVVGPPDVGDVLAIGVGRVAVVAALPREARVNRAFGQEIGHYNLYTQTRLRRGRSSCRGYLLLGYFTGYGSCPVSRSIGCCTSLPSHKGVVAGMAV